MGAQWKQAGREASAHKKGQMVVKLVREIMVAAKLGGADPDLNERVVSRNSVGSQYWSRAAGHRLKTKKKYAKISMLD